MTPQKKLHPAVAALIVVVLVGIVTTVVIIVNSQQADTPTTTQESSTTTTDTSDTTDAVQTDTSAYKDGTYSATGSYVSPGGRESIDLTVTIKNGVIISTDLGQNATDRDAKEYQEAFASGYASLVEGKNVDEVSLSRVAGSSLTSNGFNNALTQIKEDAKG